MIDLKFPDGAVRQYPEGSTARDVATSISPSLAKKAVLAELNGEQRDMGRVLESGRRFPPDHARRSRRPLHHPP